MLSFSVGGGGWERCVGVFEDLQERCVVQHSDDSVYNVEGVGVDFQPDIEGGEDLFADILSRVRHQVIVGLVYHLDPSLVLVVLC